MTKVIFNYGTGKFESMEPTMRDRFQLGGRVDLQFGGGPEAQLAGSLAAKNITLAKRNKLLGYFKDLEKYIENNAAKYSDVDKFYKDAIKKFDTPKYKDFIINSTQTQKNVRDAKPLGKLFDLKPKGTGEGAAFNYKNLFGLKGGDASSKVRYVKDMMLINMMEKNPKMINMRDNIIKILNNDLADLSQDDIRTTKAFQKQNLKASAARPNLLRSYFNSIIKDFEKKRLKVIAGSQGVEADLRNLLNKKDISEAFRKKVRTTLNNIYQGKKYGIELRNEFTKLFGKDKPIYAPTVKKGQEFFEFEHKIGKASTGVNKLPATYMLRGSYVPSSFNYAKNINFDNKLLEFMNEYKKTKSAATETKIKNLYKDFNKKSAGYLNDLTIDFDRKAGSVIVTDKTPIFKIKNYDDYKQQFAKNLKHSQAYLSTVKGGKFAFDQKEANKVIRKILPIAGGIAKATGKVLKPLGVGFGIAAVNTALKAGETNYLDLAGAYITGDATTATTNRLLREDENFRNDYLANLPEIEGVETEVFDALQKAQDIEPVQTANEIDLPEMDQTMMAAQGGRVGFQDGTPDPFIDQALAALESSDVANQFIQNNTTSVNEKIFGTEDDRTMMQRFNTMFLDPTSYPYYASKLLEGATRIPEYAVRTVPALGQAAGDIIQGREENKFERFIEAISPSVTDAAQKKLGLTSLIEEQEKRRTAPQQFTGGVLELAGELPGPATPLFLLKTPKYIKELRNLAGGAQAAKELEKRIEERIVVDQGRRDFNKVLAVGGVMGLLKSLGLDKLIGAGAKVAQKAAPELITTGGTPKYFFDFVDLIRRKGEDISEGASTVARERVYDYNGYTLYEKLDTGDIRITKNTEGEAGFYVGDGEFENVPTVVKREEVTYTPKETIIEQGKPVEVKDTYDEATVRSDAVSGGEGFETGLESIDEILELLKKDGTEYTAKELEEMGLFSGKTKKAGGGIVKQAGVSSGPPPKSGPTPHGLPSKGKNAKPIKERK